MAEEKIRMGVSSCLLGERVRYNGGHKLDQFITGTLAGFFELVPVCPEVECGLPVPREAMHLVGDPATPRLVTVQSGVDLSEQMKTYCQRRVAELDRENLSGFIFKKGSPSSGLHGVKVHGEGKRWRSGRGLFAAAVVRSFPLLPVEEEERLANPRLRENFLERVLVYHHWQELLAGPATLGSLVAFHTRMKLLLMAHSPRHYRELGRLVAEGKQLPLPKLLNRYGELLMAGMSLLVTPAKNSNVLQHIMGYFKKELTSQEKEELLTLIDQYRCRLIPLIVPMTLLRHHIARYNDAYLREQLYLTSSPMELMLRNHV